MWRLIFRRRWRSALWKVKLCMCVFLRKLLTSDDYQLMEEAAEAGNLQEVLRYAHNLKGVCATLGLTGLQAQFADIVSSLRSGDYTLPQLQAKLVAVKNDWQRTLQYIEQLESA